MRVAQVFDGSPGDVRSGLQLAQRGGFRLVNCTSGKMLAALTLVGLRRRDMLVRPRDLAERMSGMRQSETFRLPIDAARCKAHEVIGQLPQNGFTPVVENWRQLPDGQIEFTLRHLPTAD
jgi:hypothetical protein